ncbi:MAG: hypothetical protein ACF788_04520 [Novipirellula sp. JB048]
MKSRLLTSPVIGMDDTPVRLQDAFPPGMMRTGRMWLAGSNVCGPEGPSLYSVFFFHRSRAQNKATREGLSAFLADYQGSPTAAAPISVATANRWALAMRPHGELNSWETRGGWGGGRGEVRLKLKRNASRHSL